MGFAPDFHKRRHRARIMQAINAAFIKRLTFLSIVMGLASLAAQVAQGSGNSVPASPKTSLIARART